MLPGTFKANEEFQSGSQPRERVPTLPLIVIV